MTRDDIIRLALMGERSIKQRIEWAVNMEREDCAKVCENGTFLHDFSPEAKYSRACARAIRARGQE
jgi:hypothetical protein